ncbi:hypothetical protein MML48_5g00010217 [Holotrichia oblita]|uniref:Uncharacterized protein n=1 Tax=Holotrichia oblita TaxID=644536 RepID=A0ACB9T4V7_HOLOL|nr:hypothetical protein MML48_5g00010217 [Holotrichia oblita]
MEEINNCTPPEIRKIAKDNLENLLPTKFRHISEKPALFNIYKSIDISKFPGLLAFLKRISEGHEPKKSKILEIDHIKQFIIEADNNTYLAMKTILIMGYNRACRREEITNMTLDDIGTV